MRSGLLLKGILFIATSAVAQVQVDTPEETVKLQPVTTAEYRAHLQSLKMLVEGCKKDPAACDGNKVGDDERVEGNAFQVRWSWLREMLASAQHLKEPAREKILQEAAARLDEDMAFAVGTALPSNDEFQHARKKTEEVLSRPEFQTVSRQSFIEREIAKFWQWVAEMFDGVSRLGKRSPWLVPLVEWGSITLAAAGLLAWALRTLQRQRLAVRIESSANKKVWQKEADDWAELARSEAARQDWRAAVHCLYWATIVMMEGRKMWRQNRARTPREYLLLLETGSRMQQALRKLTQLFERIWYGLRPTAESDYVNALILFEELRST